MKQRPTPNTKHELLTSDNCALALIDFQPQMFFGVASHDRQLVHNNMLGLARGAKAFGVPTILTTVETEAFSGHMTPQLLDVFPENEVIERSSMNSWDDEAFVKAFKDTGKRKLVIAALWSEVCLAFPALEALSEGYDVYFVGDASGGTSQEAHQMAIHRLVQAGAVPLTWVQTVLEWQRDWAKKDHYMDVMNIMRDHAGAYGQGIEYAFTHVNGQKPNRVSSK